MRRDAATLIADPDSFVVLDPDDEQAGTSDGSQDRPGRRAPTRTRCRGRCAMSACRREDPIDDALVQSPGAAVRRCWQIRYAPSSSYAPAFDDADLLNLPTAPTSPDRKASRSKTVRMRTRCTADADQHATLMTTAEVAEHLRVTVETVLRHIAKGCLRSFRAGTRGHHRVRRSDLDAFLMAHGAHEPAADELDAFIRRTTG